MAASSRSAPRPRPGPAEEVAALAASKDLDEQLLAAAIYRSFDAYDEALALYEKVAENRPGATNVLQALAHLYDRAGDREKAQATRKRLLKRSVPGAKR